MKKEFQIDNQVHRVDIEPLGQNRFRLVKNGQATEIELLVGDNQDGQRLTILAEGQVWSAHLEVNQEGKKTVWANGRRYQVVPMGPLNPLQSQRKDRKTLQGDWAVKAEMPGKVVKILVKNNEMVEKSQALLVLEAMKMENEIKAAQAGQIREILVQAGQSVEKSQALLKVFSE